jgi:hypothetical protein
MLAQEVCGRAGSPRYTRGGYRGGLPGGGVSRRRTLRCSESHQEERYTEESRRDVGAALFAFAGERVAMGDTQVTCAPLLRGIPEAGKVRKARKDGNRCGSIFPQETRGDPRCGWAEGSPPHVLQREEL